MLPYPDGVGSVCSRTTSRLITQYTEKPAAPHVRALSVRSACAVSSLTSTTSRTSRGPQVAVVLAGSVSGARQGGVLDRSGFDLQKGAVMMSCCSLDIIMSWGDDGAMVDQVAAFPLRLRDQRLRVLLKEVARHEGVSQNVLIERAIEDDMVVRGRLMADDLQRSAEHLHQLSDEAYDRLVARSVENFGKAEGRPDPIAASALHTSASSSGETAARTGTPPDRLGVLAAFDTARR